MKIFWLIVAMLISSVSLARPLCKAKEALVANPFLNQQLRLESRQDLIFDGVSERPQIKKIEQIKDKIKPKINVMVGLQVLEKGQMKSYPHRALVKIQKSDPPVQKFVIVFEKDGKEFSSTIEPIHCDE